MVSAVMWHMPASLIEAFPPELWFTPKDFAECESFSSKSRQAEWMAVRIALKHALVVDGVAVSPLHVHVRKNDKGCPHVVVYNPETGEYARFFCSLSHKGPLVFAAYSRRAGIRIGIDMERRSWKLPYLRRRFISGQDRMIDKGDEVGDCTVLWTFKEACTKLLGSGMAYGFANVQCREMNVGHCMLRDVDGTHYVGRYAWFGKYALAVVTEPYHGSDKTQASPLRERSWYERIVRARRLRELRRRRAVTARIESVKSREVETADADPALKTEE